jgi:hypothetical protein
MQSVASRATITQRIASMNTHQIMLNHLQHTTNHDFDRICANKRRSNINSPIHRTPLIKATGRVCDTLATVHTLQTTSNTQLNVE